MPVWLRSVLTDWNCRRDLSAFQSRLEYQDRLIVREIGSKQLDSALPELSRRLGAVTLPQLEWSLSPSCLSESSPCHSTLLGYIPVWVYAGRHLSTCVTHSRNKTKARTKWELAISANTSQPAQRNRAGDGRKQRKKMHCKTFLSS